MAAGEKKTLRIVAQHANIWHTFADLDTFVHKSQVLAGHCATLGTDYDAIERSVGVSRPPEEVGADYVAAGAGLFTVGLQGPDYDMGLVRQWVKWRDSVNG